MKELLYQECRGEIKTHKNEVTLSRSLEQHNSQAPACPNPAVMRA